MTNPNGYYFGDRVNASASAFWLSGVSLSKRSVMPSAYVFVEQVTHDVREGVANKQTGGYAAYINAGAEVYLGKLNVGAAIESR